MKTDLKTIESEIDRLLNRILASKELRALSRAANPDELLGDTKIMLKMCNLLIDAQWQMKKAQHKINRN